jgi:hypothetical protein
LLANPVDQTVKPWMNIRRPRPRCYNRDGRFDMGRLAASTNLRASGHRTRFKSRNGLFDLHTPVLRQEQSRSKAGRAKCPTRLSSSSELARYANRSERGPVCLQFLDFLRARRHPPASATVH